MKNEKVTIVIDESFSYTEKFERLTMIRWIPGALQQNMNGLPQLAIDKHYPFTMDDIFIYMGDIKQMPGHAILVRMKDDKIFTAYHTEDFEEVPDDDC